MSDKPFKVSLGMTRTIKQPPGSGLCLAAAAATLLNSNKSAFNSWSLSGYIRKMPDGLCMHLADRRYMEMSDLTIVLALRGLRLGSWWNSGDLRDVKFDGTSEYSVTHTLDEAPALVIVHPEDDERESTHAVVYDNDLGMVRDPSNAQEGLCPLSDYRIAEWFPIDRFPK